MLDDIISKFSENKKLDKFEFSLRPNHDIDNPFTNISLNIIGNLKQSIDKTDKSTIAAVLLDEAEENINFSYKIYSQIVDMKPEEEGLLFKARLLEILDEIEDEHNYDGNPFTDLLNFTGILTNITENKINNDKLKNAFIITMLLFETMEEMRIRNIHVPYTLEFREYILNNQLTMLHVICARALQANDKSINNFIINEVLQYISRFAFNKNIDLCFDMLYFISLISDDESAEIITSIADELKKHSPYAASKMLVNYVNAGIIYTGDDSNKIVDFTCKNINNIHLINNIVYTCLLTDDAVCAEKILEYFVSGKKITKKLKLSFYQQLQVVYSVLQNEKKYAETAKERFALGDINAYFDAVDAYTSLGLYNNVKDELHSIACKKMPIYEYCYLLAEHKEYGLLIERFKMIKSIKDTKDAIKFMDDKGIAIYDNNTNKELLHILSEKAANNTNLAQHVQSLLSLITV
ncbi:MAG: hypothetical protein MSA07_04965 [Mucispirillum sp.]|uniref:Uncharacterized protein n=1 Tax=Candidatus Mucispirillum faecigallinarum TaxID=2838699 RepID=A0A9D2KAF0_9BACT|nr:hypothetical protein [Mucispirillum sp.]HIZ88670.1 hypothetical protein [Candidatus Mucispirillum faecigallinarum]